MWHWPSVITLVIFALTWLGTFLLNMGKWKKAIDDLYQRDTERQIEWEKRAKWLEDDIARLESWGKEVVAERIAYNDLTYMRKDMYEVRHSQLCQQVQTIIGYDLPVRLTKIEVGQKGIETAQEQILVKLEELTHNLKG